MTQTGSTTWIVLGRIALAVAFASAGAIAWDIACGHRQQMAIMNLVWPITALYWGPVALWAYFRREPVDDQPRWWSTARASATAAPVAGSATS